MDVICMWKILLPFKFDICSGVELKEIIYGDDFTTECQMLILNMEGQPLDGVLQSNGGVRALSQRDINRIIEDVNIQEKNITDEFFRMAFCFLENGYFEMSIMNLSMAFESLIKTLVFSHGILVQDLKGKGFLEKFFHDGLKLVKGASLKESEPNYYETLSIIFDARNEIAHGGRLQNVEYFEELNFYDVYNAVDDLIDDSEEIICWILSL